MMCYSKDDSENYLKYKYRILFSLHENVKNITSYLLRPLGVAIVQNSFVV